MALSDLITRPITAPLTGFNEAVQSGAVLAEGQEKLRLANEQLGLEKQKIEGEYLSKGISALTALSKTRGVNRKIIGNTMVDYFKRGGMQLDDNTTQLLLNDDQMATDLVDVTKKAQETYPGNITLQTAHIEQALSSDPERAKEVIASLKQEQIIQGQNAKAIAAEAAKMGLEISKQQFKSSEESKKETRKYIDTFAKEGKLPSNWSQSFPAGTSDEVVAAKLRGYQLTIDNAANEIEKKVTDLKDVPKSVSDELRMHIDNARSLYFTPGKGPQYATDELKKAQSIYTRYGTGQVSAEKDKVVNDFESIVDKVITKDDREKIDALEKLKMIAANPELQSNPAIGTPTIDVFVKLWNTGVVRDTAFKRQKVIGPALEELKQKLDNFTTGTVFTPNQIQWMYRAAEDVLKPQLQDKLNAAEKLAPRYQQKGLTNTEKNAIIYRRVEESPSVKNLPETPVSKKATRGVPNQDTIDFVKQTDPVNYKAKLQGLGFDVSGVK